MSLFTDSDVASCWDANADQWTSDVRSGYDVYRDMFTFPAFEAFVPPLTGLDVIDFGSGEGTNTRRFADMGARMTGVDLSERLLLHARKAEQERPRGITYVLSSFSAELPFAEASFDAVVSTLALMDGPDFAGAMRQAFRVLRPGGFLAFSILHPCFITPGLNWQKDDSGLTVSLGVSRYFDRTSFNETWRFGNRPNSDPVTAFSVPRFPRTLSDYLNAIIAAGFRIQRVDEPMPTLEACTAIPRFHRWRDLGGFLLLVLAERPK